MLSITQQWFQDQYPSDAQVVILHPSFESQHIIFPFIQHNAGQQVAIISLSAEQNNLSAFLDSIIESLHVQLGLSSVQLEAAPTDKSALTLIKSLNSLAPFSICFDSFDLIDSPTVIEWVVALAKNLPKQCQIVIGGRRLPIALIDALAQKQPTIAKKLFPVDDDRMLVNYLEQMPSNKALLEVYALGPGSAIVNGIPIDHWDGGLPRSLFFFLIDRGMTTRDEIFQTFWPELNVREATNVFHVTKRKISEILGFDLTVYWSGFYRVSPDIELIYDVVKFGEYIQNSSIADDAEAIVLLERAAFVYKGLFLGTVDAPWTNHRRDDLRSSYVDVLSTLARLYDNNQAPERALGLYSRAMAIQPHREDLVRGIMGIYKQLGQPERAVATYQRLEISLKTQLKVAPDKKTTELLDQIKVKKASRSKHA